MTKDIGKASVFFASLAILCAIAVQLFSIDLRPLWSEEVYGVVAAAGDSDFSAYKRLGNALAGRETSAGEVADLARLRPERSVIDTIRFLQGHDRHHFPLYYTALQVYGDLFGDQTATLRIFSVLCFVLCFPALWWLTRELGLSQRARGLTIALFAFSPVLLFYGQMIREYGFWSLTILLAHASFLRALRKNRGQAWALYGFCLLVTLYTNLFSALLLPTHALLVLMGDRSRWKPFAWSEAAAAALYAPLAITLAFAITTMERATDWAYPPEWTLGWYAAKTGESMAFFFGWPIWLAAIILPCALAWGFRTSLRERSSMQLLVMFFLPLGAFFVYDLAKHAMLTTTLRYMLVALLPLAILTGAFLDRLAGALGRAHALVYLLPLLSAFHSLPPMAKAPFLPLMKHSFLAEAASRARSGEFNRIVTFQGKTIQNWIGLARSLPPETPWQVLAAASELRHLPATETVLVFGPTKDAREEELRPLELRFAVERAENDHYWVLRPKSP